MSTIINATTTNGVVIQPDNSGSLVLQTNNGTTALTIDTSQNITTTNKLAVASMPTGSVVQVVSTIKTDQFTTTATSFTDVTGLSVSITPSSVSNKILVIANPNLSGGNIQVAARLVRDSTALAVGNSAGSRVQATVAVVGNASANDNAGMPMSLAINFLDSPATTSATTYKIQMQVNSGTGYLNSASDDQDAAYRARTSSTITVMEIKG